MAIKLSGLNSGMDTESIIQELVRAKSEKKIKLDGLARGINILLINSKSPHPSTFAAL